MGSDGAGPSQMPGQIFQHNDELTSIGTVSLEGLQHANSENASIQVASGLYDTFSGGKNCLQSFGPTEEIKLVAEKEILEKKVKLGVTTQRGWNVPRNCKRAVQLFQEAANGKNDNGLYQFGLCYYYGMGIDIVAKDEREAVKWYRLAAEQGHAQAQNNLGFCYEKGYGVAPDIAEAVRLYFKAAAQGNETAKKNLTVLGMKV